MSGEREPDPADIERGLRMAKLRRAAGYERQLDLARAGSIDRVDVNRVETGKNRFRSESLQTRYAQAFGVTVGTMLEYAAGSIGLDELRGKWAPKATPPPSDTPSKALELGSDPLPNRAAAIELLLPKFPGAVLSSLRRMSFKGGEDLEVSDFVEKAKELLKLYQEIDADLDDDEPASSKHAHEDPQAPPTLAKIAEVASRLPPKKKKKNA